MNTFPLNVQVSQVLSVNTMVITGSLGFWCTVLGSYLNGVGIAPSITLGFFFIPLIINALIDFKTRELVVAFSNLAGVLAVIHLVILANLNSINFVTLFVDIGESIVLISLLYLPTIFVSRARSDMPVLGRGDVRLFFVSAIALSGYGTSLILVFYIICSLAVLTIFGVRSAVNLLLRGRSGFAQSYRLAFGPVIIGCLWVLLVAIIPNWSSL